MRNTSHWYQLRRKVIQDRQFCLVCGRYGDVVHHRHYENYGAENDEDLVLLCAGHHNELHKIAKEHHRSYDDALAILVEQWKSIR